MLCKSFISPPIFNEIYLLEANPRPMLSFCGFYIKPCIDFSSNNGMNKYSCLYSLIPIPESIISVSNI
jgi:hypothetical protein